MKDTIKPSAEEYHAVYSASFKTWSRLRSQALAEPAIPSSPLSLTDAFLQYPHFPPNLNIKYAKYRRHSRAYASGSSEWGSGPAGCRYGMPLFRQPVDITVTAKNAIPLSIQSNQENSHISNGTASQNQKFVSVLILAWTYVLSARWVELMPEESSIAYNNIQALGETSGIPQPSPNSTVEVCLGNHSPEEARWWAAVLAPGRGWHATMVMEQDELLAPWSVSLEQSPVFTFSGQLELPSSSSKYHDAASSTQSLQFLDKFCRLHNLDHQSSAALAAALLLPSEQGTRSLSLPASTADPWEHETESMPTSGFVASPERAGRPQHMTHQHLDRLLTLSCHVRGIASLLFGVFFNPDIECNKAGPWLQGALDVINPMVTSQPWVLGRMLMKRLPEVAPLWLGATVLGLQEKLVRQVGYGQIPIDFHAAVWSGTIQTFIQMPISGLLRQTDWISRADECRLLFLAQTEAHCRAPFCQWPPFGVTFFDDVDVEVRAHKDCTGHALQYKGITWDCDHAQTRQTILAVVSNVPRSVATGDLNDSTHDFKAPESLDHSKEFISEVATRSILNWLRPDGCTSREKEIWAHDWMDMPESDEDEEVQNCATGKGSFSGIRSWIEGLKVDPDRVI